MRKIQECTIDIVDQQTLMVPGDFDILDLRLQNGKITIYADVVQNSGQQAFYFFIAATGTDITTLREMGAVYIGSVYGDNFAWHAYIKPALIKPVSH